MDANREMELQSLIYSLSRETQNYVKSVLANMPDLQSLIDLLAKETEKYTKACVAKIPEQISLHKAMVESLIAEIYRRRRMPIPQLVGSVPY